MLNRADKRPKVFSCYTTTPAANSNNQSAVSVSSYKNWEWKRNKALVTFVLTHSWSTH